MDKKDARQLEILEREKRIEQLKLEEEKRRFAELIKKTGKEQLSAEALIKKPNKRKIFVNKIKKLIKRIFETL